MVPDETRRGRPGSPATALASAIAGGLLVPYAASKGTVSAWIVAEGWAPVGLSPSGTALLFHLLETVPMVLLLLGFLELRARSEASGPLALVGVGVTVAGFVAVVLTHFGEHLLAAATVPSLTGGADLFVWGYYLSWLAILGGLAASGLALRGSATVPRWLAALLVVLAPAAVAVGLAAAVADVFTLAGTFRVSLGLAWVAVGGWLWRQPDGGAGRRTLAADGD